MCFGDYIPMEKEPLTTTYHQKLPNEATFPSFLQEGEYGISLDKVLGANYIDNNPTYFGNGTISTQSSRFIPAVSPSTQPIDSRMPVPLVPGQCPGGEPFDDISQTAVSALASSSSHWTMGVDLLEHFFPEDPSFLFLVFEEMKCTEPEVHINKNTKKHVLHPL
jgi:hypothetical protein